MTAPYQARAALELGRGVDMVHTATLVDHNGTEYPLDIEEWQLDVDEERAPHARLRLRGPMPADDVLDVLDPTLEQLVVLTAGYRYADMVEDVHELARLRLVEATPRDPAGTLELVAASDELRVDDANPGVALDAIGWPVEYASVHAALEALVDAPITSTIDPATPTPDEYPLAIHVENLTDRLDYARGWADAVGAWLYCDQLLEWHLDPAPAIGASTAILATGPGGTLTDVIDRRSRTDGWGSVVVTTYDGSDKYSILDDTQPGELPRVVRFTGQQMPAGEDGTGLLGEIADPANVGRLARVRQRSRRLEVAGAPALWLRAGHTITVAHRTRPQARVIVSAITTTSRGAQQLRTRSS